MDENTERRNHYLDLAGIENYTSKFGPGRYWRIPTLYLPFGCRFLPKGAGRQGALELLCRWVPGIHTLFGNPIILCLDVDLHLTLLPPGKQGG